MDQSATRETDLISLPYPLNQQALPKKNNNKNNNRNKNKNRNRNKNKNKNKIL